eukprot:TRINITY_DN7856_c0_g1_i2.p1 TRINITY_DN7856_c0_g1~~TRINITY_DN7856_c0_g1_i2.p1  ORF type:complete len:157 (+),score=16.45 TRINITY_DN7856_c0_g1_i2:195-665(+)
MSSLRQRYTPAEGSSVAAPLDGAQAQEGDAGVGAGIAESLLWASGAAAVLYFTDFINVCLYSTEVSRPWFNVGVAALAVNVVIGLYLAYFLPYVKGIKERQWEGHSPYAIPVATAAAVIGSICLTVGLWPVWTFFTPFMLFFLLMGLLMILRYIPF